MADYERDILGKVILDLTAIREMLAEAAVHLANADRLLTEAKA